MTKQIKKYDILFVILFVFVLSFLLYKVRYGYIFNDEPYLLGLGYRFALGDALLVDEWSIMQLVGFLIYPFTKVFTIINNDTTGIILYGRYCFIFLWSLSVVYSYIRLRKYKYWAGISLMSFYLFAPLDMMTLSYNSFCLMGLLCFTSTIVSAKNNYEYIFVGIFLSIAVICNPFIVLIYLLFSILALINIKFKKNYLPNDINISKAWLFLTIGCAIMFLMFVGFVLSRASLSTVINSIRYILASNTEHTVHNLFELIIIYIKELNMRFDYILIYFPIIIIISLIDKGRYKRKIIYILASLILIYFSFENILENIETYPNLNLTVIPLIVMGIVSFILSKKKDYNIFIYFIVFGIIYSFLYQQSSNLGLPAIGISYSLITCGSILLIGNLINETSYKKIVTYLLLFSVGMQFYYQGLVRYERYYLDNDVTILKHEIEVGPAKGIVTNPTDWEVYSWHYQQFQMLMYDATDEDVFYYPYSNPWYYFATNMKFGTYSTWGSWGDPIGTHEINKLYFKVKPHKYPTYVLLNRNDDIQLYDLIEELNDKNYEKRETDDFVLYFK